MLLAALIVQLELAGGIVSDQFNGIRHVAYVQDNVSNPRNPLFLGLDVVEELWKMILFRAPVWAQWLKDGFVHIAMPTKLIDEIPVDVGSALTVHVRRVETRSYLLWPTFVLRCHTRRRYNWK